jgi:hypothetical protein
LLLICVCRKWKLIIPERVTMLSLTHKAFLRLPKPLIAPDFPVSKWFGVGPYEALLRDEYLLQRRFMEGTFIVSAIMWPKLHLCSRRLSRECECRPFYITVRIPAMYVLLRASNESVDFLWKGRNFLKQSRSCLRRTTCDTVICAFFDWRNKIKYSRGLLKYRSNENIHILSGAWL